MIAIQSLGRLQAGADRTCYNVPMPVDPGNNPGLLLIISGPSGVGKTTITHHVEKRLNGIFSVSMTTRPQTAADKEGYDYFFVCREEFEAMIKRG